MNSKSKCKLKLAWTNIAAARYACAHWHYSGTIPMPPYNVVGVWERDEFIGVVIFSRGATPHLGAEYGLDQTQLCECTRIALAQHETPVSRIIRIALMLMRAHCPGIRMVVSFADTLEKHHGGIYQASNWYYVGETAPHQKWLDKNGRMWHNRQVSRTGINREFGKYRAGPKQSECTRIQLPGKHKYVLPLDPSLTELVRANVQPYPKRAKQASVVTRNRAVGQRQPARSISA